MTLTPDEIAEFVEAKEWMARNQEWLEEHHVSTLADLLSRIRSLTVETVRHRAYWEDAEDREGLKRSLYRGLVGQLAAELLDRASRVNLIEAAGHMPGERLVRARAKVLCVLPAKQESGKEVS